VVLRSGHGLLALGMWRGSTSEEQGELRRAHSLVSMQGMHPKASLRHTVRQDIWECMYMAYISQARMLIHALAMMFRDAGQRGAWVPHGSRQLFGRQPDAADSQARRPPLPDHRGEGWCGVRTSGLCWTRCWKVMLELYVVPVSASMPTLKPQPRVTRSS